MRKAKNVFIRLLGGLLIAVIKALRAILDYLGQDDVDGVLDTTQLLDNVGCWLGDPTKARITDYKNRVTELSVFVSIRTFCHVD